MRCPMCRTRLITLVRDGVEVDHCPSCQGVWLDGGELDALAAQIRRAGVGGGDEPDDGSDAAGADEAGAEPDAGVLVWDAVFRRELQMLAPSELRRMTLDQVVADGGWPQDAAAAARTKSARATDGPRCPVCDGSLTVARRHGVRLDVCSTCRGIWFDPGELESVLARADRDGGPQ